jgi:hypothetical protein
MNQWTAMSAELLCLLKMAATAGYREFGNVLVDERVPTIERLPEDRRAAKKLLIAAIRTSGLADHPPAAVHHLDLKGLGFQPTRLSLPMPWEWLGTTSWRSGRLHAHQAGDIYLVHQDKTAPGKNMRALLSVEHGVNDLLPALVRKFTHTSERSPAIIQDATKS